MERSTLRDQLEMRVALEAEAARLAAQRRDGADLDTMHSALAARGAAGQNLPLRIQHDRDFHQAMIAAAHNRALAELYRYFSEAVARTIARARNTMTPCRNPASRIMKPCWRPWNGAMQMPQSARFGPCWRLRWRRCRRPDDGAAAPAGWL